MARSARPEPVPAGQPARAPDSTARTEPYNIVCVVQDGRLSYEALLFAASFRAANPGFSGRLLLAEPQPGPLWQGETRVRPVIRALLEEFGDRKSVV